MAGKRSGFGLFLVVTSVIVLLSPPPLSSSQISSFSPPTSSWSPFLVALAAEEKEAESPKERGNAESSSGARPKSPLKSGGEEENNSGAKPKKQKEKKKDLEAAAEQKVDVVEKPKKPDPIAAESGSLLRGMADLFQVSYKPTIVVDPAMFLIGTILKILEIDAVEAVEVEQTDGAPQVDEDDPVDEGAAAAASVEASALLGAVGGKTEEEAISDVNIVLPDPINMADMSENFRLNLICDLTDSLEVSPRFRPEVVQKILDFINSLPPPKETEEPDLSVYRPVVPQLAAALHAYKKSLKIQKVAKQMAKRINSVSEEGQDDADGGERKIWGISLPSLSMPKLPFSQRKPGDDDDDQGKGFGGLLSGMFPSSTNSFGTAVRRLAETSEGEQKEQISTIKNLRGEKS